MYANEIKQIENGVERETAYRNAVATCEYFQDSLSLRIQCNVGLSETEQLSLFQLVSARCRKDTKAELWRSIQCIPSIRSYGIFGRVLFNNGVATYCAGQDYTAELPVVRKCLL